MKINIDFKNITTVIGTMPVAYHNMDYYNGKKYSNQNKKLIVTNDRKNIDI